MPARRASALLLAALAACAGFAASEPTSAAATATAFDVKPFHSVQVCTPYAVLIAPGPLGLSVDADANVTNAVVATVAADGVLRLGSTSFSSGRPIKMTVSLPAPDLRAVMASGGGPVAVAPGFAPADGTLALALTGSGNLVAPSLNVSVLTLTNSGTAALMAGGAVGKARVTASGAGAIMLSGVEQSVTVNLGGVGPLFLAPSSPETVIDGAVAGMAGVQTTQGRCLVQSQFGGFFGPPCALVPAVPAVSAPTWTCGMAVDGEVGCNGARGVVVSAAGLQQNGGGGGVATGNGGMMVSSGGGGGATFVSSSSGPGGVFMTQSPGGGGVSYTNGGAGGAAYSSSGGGATFVGGAGPATGVFMGGAPGAGYTVLGAPGGGVYVNGVPVRTQAVQAPACRVGAANLTMVLSA